MIENRYILTGLCSSVLIVNGCMTAPALPDHQRPEHWGNQLSAAHNFYQVSSWVYRSEQPSSALLPLLKQKNIKTVINLRTHDRDSGILEGENTQVIHLPIRTWAMNREQLLGIMRYLKQAQHSGQKVLIHCYHGSDRTGASIAMYRIVFENWSTEQALLEMKHGGYGYHVIWKNIERLFSTKNIQWTRQQLQSPEKK